MSRYNNGSSGHGGGSKENGNAKDSLFDLDSADFASDQFRMHEFKVKRCPRARPHDWTQCPFAHPGEKARRRDPRRYKYSGTACPEFRKSGCCRRGDACPFAHGVFECWLHPSRYRTQLCTDGTACRRRVCFFAHVESELRHPEDDPGVAQKQVQAELAAEVQTLQQQHLTQALQALLLQTTNPLTPPDRQPLGNAHSSLTNEMLKQHNPPTLPAGAAAGNGVNHNLTDIAIDHGNPTAALQLALLQQLQQQQHSNGEKATTTAAVGINNHMNGEGSAGLLASENTPVTTTGAVVPPMADVLGALSQLQQLTSMSATTATPVVVSGPPANSNGSSVDAAAFLSQIMSGNGHGNGTNLTPNHSNGGNGATGPDLSNNPMLISSLMGQNAAKMAMINGNTSSSSSSARRSIDNSYLTSYNPESANAALAFGSSGFPSGFQNGTYIPNVNAMTQDLNSATSSANSAASVHAANVPVSGAQSQAMYSMENIQLLLQNPAFSSNLSQLFQMNPALLQQLTTANDSGNQSRHSIDNAYLTQLSTDMNRLVNNGGMSNGGSTANATGIGVGLGTGAADLQIASDVISHQHAQQTPESLLAPSSSNDVFGQNGGAQRFSNGITVSEALIQGLNALKLQIEGGNNTGIPASAPMTIHATPIGDDLSQIPPLSNHSSSDNSLNPSSDTSGGDIGGNNAASGGGGPSASEPQVESFE